MATAGSLRERVRFEQRGLDENNDRLGPWVAPAALGSVAAEIIYLRRGETVIASRLQGQQPAIITVWANANTRLITTAWRAVDLRTGQVFDLKTVEPDTERRFIAFMAVSDGQGGGV